MFKFVMRRALTLLPTLILASAFAFFITMMLPGDAAVTMVGEFATVEQLERARERLGLNEPITTQYGLWIWRSVQGDFGRSLRLNRPVREVIAERLPVTAQLTLGAIALAIVIGVPAGVISAIRSGSVWDTFSTFVSLAGVAMPNFLLGILLILVFAVYLRVLPPSGYVSFLDDPLGNLRSLVLPAFAASSTTIAVVMRQTRSAMLEVLSEDYIRTARSKGLRMSSVYNRHALRNALIPIVTVIGLQLGTLFSGAVITETIFALPGLGRLLVDSIMGRDFPLVQGLLLFSVFAVVLVNFFVDALYGVINPSLRYE